MRECEGKDEIVCVFVCLCVCVCEGERGRKSVRESGRVCEKK